MGALSGSRVTLFINSASNDQLAPSSLLIIYEMNEIVFVISTSKIRNGSTDNIEVIRQRWLF